MLANSLLMIQKVIIPQRIHDYLIRIANKYSPNIICGLLSGTVHYDTIIVEEAYPIPTRSGPKVHFKPVWSAYYDVKNMIYESRKSIVAEFHTHPDGSEELNVNDKKILKKLGKGLWILVTCKGIVPWYFEMKNKSEGFYKKIDVQLINDDS